MTGECVSASVQVNRHSFGAVSRSNGGSNGGCLYHAPGFARESTETDWDIRGMMGFMH